MLDVQGLSVRFDGADGVFVAVNNISFAINKGEIVGIAGESGSGKSLTALSLAGVLPETARAEGLIQLAGRKLRPGYAKDWQNVRGRLTGIVFQEPLTCLNPVINVGTQVSEVLRIHKSMSEKDAVAETLRIFAKLGLHPPKLRMRQYPHQLSGGQRQRVMLAIALCCQPPLIIADEPTTALDVTVQAQILLNLRNYIHETQASLLLITHDLGVMAYMADRILIMYAGRVVEEANADELFRKPAHPYTQLLLQSVPRIDRPLKRPVSWLMTPAQPKAGCEFAPRCTYRRSICTQQAPASLRLSGTWSVRCHI
ncbi:MAG: ABC transporter ATP-binding protein [Clostridiales bacterium]|nr:ABC transporter ATP-binding protein [Clostridiales bacterium]